MAGYGLKYLCEYRSKMRGRLLYRIEVEERDAAARTDDTALRMRPYSDVFSLKWGNSDDPEYTAVKGSSLTLKILCVDDMEYLSLFSVDPLKYRITIYEYRTDVSGQDRKLMLWRGFLSAGSYKEAFARPPYVVTLSATDGFALLDSMPFWDDSGAKFSGQASLSSLLSSCVDALGIGLPVSEWVSIDGTGGAERTLKNIYVDRTRIYQIDGEISWKSVLELAVKPFLGQIFQAGGAIHVRRIGSLAGAFRPASFLSNERLIGLERPRILPLWEDRCDLRSSSDLELCAPYRNVAVSVENSAESDSNTSFYSEDSWVDKVNVANSYFFGDRVVIAGVTASAIAMELPPFFEPADAANVDVSLTVSNMMTAACVTGEIAVIAKIGSRTMKWNPDNNTWAEDTGSFEYNFSIDPVGGTDPTWGYRVSIYTPASRLGGYDFRTTITNLPANDEEVEYRLFVRIIFQPANLETESRSLILVSGIGIQTTAGDGRADVLSADVPVSSLSTSDCEVSIPIRDGGYHLNMKSVLTCPITDVQNEPIVSWLAPTERGDLLHMAGEDILRLRSAVRHQIAGEQRCQRSVDLNSLFEDGKFTRSVYYLNSLELLAARQVYKVQLRELQSLDRMLPAGVLTSIRTFDEPMTLVCSLYGSLFFRTGEGPYGVAIYNTENGELRYLPYSSGDLAIRKGLSAVVIQVGTTDLYAVDNLGGVLSHLDAGPSSVLNYATALYDGDRHSWVSYTANAAASKTDVTIFTRNMELESKNDMAVVATGLTLISNGYVLQVADGPAWWHNYELHPSEKIELSAYDAGAISDSLLMSREESLVTISVAARRRSGQMLDADQLLSRINTSSHSLEGISVTCNCAIAAILYKDVLSNRIVICYDARTGRTMTHSFRSDVQVAVCADRVYIQNGSELLGCRLYDTPDRDYFLRLNNSDGNYSTTVMALTTFFAVPLETNGTVVVKYEGIDYIHPEVAPDKRSITFTVSENTSPKERVCSILVTLEEDPTVQRYVVVTQKGAVQVPYYLTIDGSTEDYVASVDSGTGMLSVPVQTNGTVEVLTNGASFLTPSVSENNTSISIAVASNAGEARNGTLTVRLVEDTSIVRYITVKQEGASDSYYLKVRGTTFNTGITDIPADGADYSLKVETNGTPYIVSKDDRIEASLSGDGSTVYYIAVTIPKNASTSPVNYEDLVTGIREDDSLRRKTSFKQSGAAQADYYLTINGSTDDYYVDVDAGAHELTVPIQTNGTATVFAQGSPFVSPVVSDDNASVTITVDPNDGGVSRNGTIRVSIAENPDLERFIVVRQSNVSSYCLKINGQDSDAAYRDVPAEGAEYHPSIETNGTPRIVSKDNRLEAVFRQEASGVSGIDIVVPENDMADPVTYENIVIDLEEDNAVRRAISVSQLAAPYYLRLNGSEDRYETTVSSAAQSFTLPVETNGTPKVMPLPLEYIRIELSADGMSVTFTLDENTASEDRVIQALITLEEDSSVQRYVTITQQKAEPHVEITFSNLTSLKLYFKNPDITSAYGTVDAGSDVRIVPEGDIGFYQMTTPALILKIVSVVSGVECGHWESAAPRRYVFEYDLFKREVYDKTGETEVMIKSGF